MDRTELLAAIEDIVKDTLGLKEIRLSPESSAKDVERWDSVSNIGIIMGIEQEFDFRFDLGELDSFKTIGDMMDAIARHTQP